MAAIVPAVLIALAATAPNKLHITPGWYSVIPPLLAVSLALLTRKIYLSLAAAILVGGLLTVWAPALPWETVSGGVSLACRFVVETLVDPTSTQLQWTNIQILAYVVLIMVAIAVMVAAGGLHALAGCLQRWARSPRSAQLAAFLGGVVVFIDDYANTMIVGSTFRPMTDRHRVSRAKLAFLVDATAAPVAGLALLSTWIGYEVGLLGEIGQSLGIHKGGYELFLSAIGFRYYCIAMLGFVLLNVITGVDFGPMAAAESAAIGGRKRNNRAAGDAEPEVSVGKAEPEVPDGRSEGLDGVRSVTGEPRKNVWTALLPLAVLLAVFLGGLWFDGGGPDLWAGDRLAPLHLSSWRSVLSTADSIRLLALASAVSLCSAVALAWCVARLSMPQIARALLQGMRAAMLPVTVLILAWALKRTCDTLGTGPYLAQLLAAGIWAPVFPMLVFLVACACSFATGTSWGTMAIVLPTALPVAHQIDGGSLSTITVVTIAAVLDGAIFGDHCSPISDTTIMSAAAADCPQVEHVRTQLPYAVVVAVVVLLGAYFPAGLGLPNWLGIAISLVAVALLLALVGTFSRKRHSSSSPPAACNQPQGIDRSGGNRLS